ncbi:MAG: redoxin domain-containing protein [Armatimonadetes bacterium]|nr:redoxin domain-containing protein [Armatimonadota bacterium]
MLQSEQVAPDFCLPTLDGRVACRSDYRRQHRNLALLFLPAVLDHDWRNLLRDLSVSYAALQDANADALVIVNIPVPDAVALAEELELPLPVAVDERGDVTREYDVPDGAVIVLDRYGAPEEVWRPPTLPRAHDIVAAAQRSEMACPECSVTHWPVETAVHAG